MYMIYYTDADDEWLTNLIYNWAFSVHSISRTIYEDPYKKAKGATQKAPKANPK